jgi:hypothetical protein
MVLSKKTRIWMAGLCLAVTLIVAATAAVSVFLRGDGAFVEVTSPRGETYRMITDGIYQYNSERMVAEGVGWDIFTLFISVPAMLIAIPFVYKGSLRGRLFATGLLAYYFYQYFMYALAWAFGPLFVPFLLVFASSLAVLILIVTSIDAKDLAARASDRFPNKGMAILSVAMGLMLTMMWAQRIAAALTGDYATAMLYGQTTLVVQVLDLGLLVPLSIFTGVMIWKRKPAGYLLSAVFAVKSVAMAAAILAMLLSAWMVEKTLDIGGFAMFGTAMLLSLWLGMRMYRAIRE